MSTSIVTETATVADWLQSLGRHLAGHPHIQACAADIRARDHSVQLYPHGFNRNHLAALVAWVDTLTDVGPVKVTCSDAANGLHLLVTGRLDDGSPVSLVCLPNQGQVAALKDRTSIDADEQFDFAIARAALSGTRVTS